MARHQHAAGHTSPLHVFCIPCSCRQFTIIQPFFSSCRRVGRSDLFCNQRICHHPAVDRRGAGTGVRFAEGLLHAASLSHSARLLLLSIGRVNFQLGGLDTGERDREDRIRFLSLRYKDCFQWLVCRALLVPRSRRAVLYCFSNLLGTVASEKKSHCTVPDVGCFSDLDRIFAMGVWSQSHFQVFDYRVQLYQRGSIAGYL